MRLSTCQQGLWSSGAVGNRLGRESSGDVDHNSDKGSSGGVWDIDNVRVLAL